MEDRNEQQVHPDGTVHFNASIGGGEPQELVFRVPDVQDLAELDVAFPLLEVDDKEEEQLAEDPHAGLEVILSDPKKTVRFMRRANRLLLSLAIKPKFVEEPTVEPVEGTHCVRAISSHDRIFMFLALLGLGGFNADSAVQIAPFVETEPSCGRATTLHNDTVADPADS